MQLSLSTVNAINACKKSRGIPPPILKLRARWRWMVNITLRLLNPPTRTLVPTEERLGGPQSRGGRFGEDKSLAPIVIRTPDRPACSLASTPTTLSWLANEHTEKIERKFAMITDKQTQGNLSVCTWCSFRSCVHSNFSSGPFWIRTTCSPQESKRLWTLYIRQDYCLNVEDPTQVSSSV